jgi:hypothetical protein
VTFWLNVGLGYLLLLAVGTAVGAFLGRRDRRGGGGGGGVEPTVPDPVGPMHAAEWPPLGSDFDRALLPGAFDSEHLPV